MLKNILLGVVRILKECHVPGSEAKKYSEAIDTLEHIIEVLGKQEGGEKTNENQDEQGQ